MRRFGVLMATAALGSALVVSGPAWAGMGGGGGWGHGGGGWGHGGMAGWGHGFGHFHHFRNGFAFSPFVVGGGWNYGYPYWNDAYYGYGYPAYGYGYPDYAYDYGYPATGPSGYYAAAPRVTGRATGQVGNYCTISVKTCLLHHASYVGGACSCRVPGGHARGTVSP